MSEFLQLKSLRKLLKGQKVERPTAGLPATAQEALFNVIGGRVAITQIIGEVTTVIQTQACNTSLVANPTTGTDVALCAVLNITADEVGTLYGITGTNADAMLGINAGSVPGQLRDVIVAEGTIDLLTAATNTGEVAWTVFYVPIDDGAYITAA